MAEPSQDPEYLVGLAGNSGLFGHPGDMSGGMWVFYFLVKYMIFFSVILVGLQDLTHARQVLSPSCDPVYSHPLG